MGFESVLSAAVVVRDPGLSVVLGWLAPWLVSQSALSAKNDRHRRLFGQTEWSEPYVTRRKQPLVLVNANGPVLTDTINRPDLQPADPPVVADPFTQAKNLVQVHAGTEGAPLAGEDVMANDGGISAEVPPPSHHCSGRPLP